MGSELDPVMVLADRMQAEGDPRGELLALELAAALAPTVADSRRACREASAIRAKDPDLAWPRALWESRGQIRAGLLVAGTWSPKRAPKLPSSLGPWTRELVLIADEHHLGLQSLIAASDEVGLRLDGLWQAYSSTGRAIRPTLDLEPTQTFELPALGLMQPLENPLAFRQLRGLVDLRLDRIDAEWWSSVLERELPALPLRTLSVPIDSPNQLAVVLDACPNLERLRTQYFGQPLEPHSGLERLRSLEIVGSLQAVIPVGQKLSDALALSRLESLALTGAEPRDVEQLAPLGLRRLELFGRVDDPAELHLALARLDTLEHLGLHWRHTRHRLDPLAQLSRLRTLELAGWAEGELSAPPSLQRLVFHDSMSWAQIHGSLPEIHGRWNTAFELDGHFDLTRTRMLGFGPFQSRPQVVERPEERLGAVETVVLEGDQDQARTLAWLRSLPSLRTVICPELTIRQQRALSEGLPDMQILGGNAAWLRRDFPAQTRFDPLDPQCWPKCA